MKEYFEAQQQDILSYGLTGSPNPSRLEGGRRFFMEEGQEGLPSTTTVEKTSAAELPASRIVQVGIPKEGEGGPPIEIKADPRGAEELSNKVDLRPEERLRISSPAGAALLDEEFKNKLFPKTPEEMEEYLKKRHARAQELYERELGKSAESGRKVGRESPSKPVGGGAVTAASLFVNRMEDLQKGFSTIDIKSAEAVMDFWDNDVTPVARFISTPEQLKEFEEEREQILEQITRPGLDPEVVRNRGKRILRELKERAIMIQVDEERRRQMEAMREEEGREGIPESLEDLAEYIMIQEGKGSAYAIGEEKALLEDIVNKEGKTIGERVNLNNFLAWVRQKIIFFHRYHGTDQANFFQEIVVQVGHRFKNKIDLYTLLTHEAAFHKRGATTPEEDQEYKDFRLNVFLETWLFQTSRNYDVAYRAERGSDTKLPEILFNMYKDNVFTREVGPLSNFERLLGLSSYSGIKEADGKKEYDNDVGFASRQAFLAYCNLSNYAKLRDMLGDKSLLFQEKYYKTDENPNRTSAYRLITKSQEKQGEGKEKEREWKESWYDASGKLRDTDEVVKSQFIKYVNIFNFAQRDPAVVGEVRERIRQTLMDSLGEKLRPKIEENFTKYAEEKEKKRLRRLELTDEEKKALKPQIEQMIQQRIYEEASYAEEIGFSMMRWTGAAARLDAEGIGFDVWNRVQELQRYRMRQSAGDEEKGGRRGGIIGNIYNFDIVKRLGLNFLTGVTTKYVQKDRNPDIILEVLERGVREWKTDDIRIDKEIKKDDKVIVKKQKDEDRLLFKEDTMKEFAGLHIVNAFNIFHKLIEAYELDFAKFTTIDRYGNVTFDVKQANAFMDEFMKSFRNAYRTWRLEFDRDVMVQTDWEEKGEGDNRYEKLTFKTMKIAEALFGEEVLRRWRESKDPKNKDNPKYKDLLLWREPFLGLIAAEKRAHWAWNSPYTTYDMYWQYVVDGFLRRLPAGIKPGEIAKTKFGRFFTEEEIRWIHKMSGTEPGRVFRTQFIEDVFVGGFSGLKGVPRFILRIIELSDELRGL